MCCASGQIRLFPQDTCTSTHERVANTPTACTIMINFDVRVSRSHTNNTNSEIRATNKDTTCRRPVCCAVIVEYRISIACTTTHFLMGYLMVFGFLLALVWRLYPTLDVGIFSIASTVLRIWSSRVISTEKCPSVLPHKCTRFRVVMF